MKCQSVILTGIFYGFLIESVIRKEIERLPVLLKSPHGLTR
jgi:hypothetical protein